MEPEQITIESIRAAARRIDGYAERTPLVRLQFDDFPGEIWLKLENLQPVGSFKIRGAANALLSASPQSLRNGVVTASAGNMAQGVAWMARALGIACSVVVPEGAASAKIDAIHRLGGRTIAVPYAAWWQTLLDRAYPGVEGKFIHPVADADVIAGNGTIGLEIDDDLADADAVLVPVGGGGLASGIAAALRAVQPDAKVYGCEPDTAAPLNASFKALEPVAVDRKPSFVDGCGGRAVLPEMWPLVREFIAGTYAPTVAQIAAAVKLLAERAKIVAEGAGATALAAALGEKGPSGRVVCIVSGGCIDADKLAVILNGAVP